MPTIYLSLGSNLGDRAAHLRDALARLEANGQVHITGVSRFYETAPVGETPEPVPDYLNGAARAETTLAPLALLAWTQAVERMGGRAPTFRWGPRTIDIDLLIYDRVTMNSERLVIPHPRLYTRAFVLVPLADLEPGLVFPDGSTLAERLRDPVVRSQALRVWQE